MSAPVEERQREILERAREAEAQRKAGVSEAVLRPVVHFRLGEEHYAIGVEAVVEVTEIGKVVTVPGAPSVIAGVMNLRGEVVPLINLDHLLMLPASDQSRHSRILITTYRDQLVGLLVDSVEGLREIPEADILPPAATTEAVRAGFVEGEVKVDEGVLSVLDFNNLMRALETGRYRGG